MLNGSGSIVARYSYDAYGNTTLVSGTNLATFQYANYYTHQPSGLNLTKFRAYDPSDGRWLSRDSLKDAEIMQTPNLYEYVGNSPIELIDPLGMEWTCDAWILERHGALEGEDVQEELVAVTPWAFKTIIVVPWARASYSISERYDRYHVTGTQRQYNYYKRVCYNTCDPSQQVVEHNAWYDTKTIDRYEVVSEFKKETLITLIPWRAIP
jgi:RHS repeat-associated protein